MNSEEHDYSSDEVDEVEQVEQPEPEPEVEVKPVKVKKPRPPKTEKQLEAFRSKCLTAKAAAAEERRKLRQAALARSQYNPDEDDAVKVIRWLQNYRAKQQLENMVRGLDLSMLDSPILMMNHLYNLPRRYGQAGRNLRRRKKKFNRVRRPD